MWGLAGCVALVLCVWLGMKVWSSDDYLRALPARSKALAVIDIARLQDEAQLTAEDLEALLSDDEKDSGIDWSKAIYAFVTERERAGVLAAVNDESALESFLRKQAEAGVCTEMEKRSGYHWTLCGGSWLLGFGDGRLLVMGPCMASETNELRQEMLKCFRQDKEESGMQSSLFADVSKKNAPLSLVARMDVLPMSYIESFMMKIPEHAWLSDVNLSAGVHIGKEGVIVDGEINSANKDINRYIEETAKIGGTVNAAFADYVPEDALLWGCLNVDGANLLEELRQIPSLRTALIGLNMTFDADRIISSMKGDVAITVKSAAWNASGNYLLSAQLENDDFLNGSDSWGKSVLGNSLMEFRSLGNQTFSVAWDDTPQYFGVKGGDTFFLTSDAAWGRDMHAVKTRTLDAWKSEMKDSRLFLWLNLDMARRLSGDMIPAGMDVAERFDALTVAMLDTRHITLKVCAKDKNLNWKELLDKWKE